MCGLGLPWGSDLFLASLEEEPEEMNGARGSDLLPSLNRFILGTINAYSEKVLYLIQLCVCR